jgi:hypothetical protein
VSRIRDLRNPESNMAEWGPNDRRVQVAFDREPTPRGLGVRRHVVDIASGDIPIR